MTHKATFFVFTDTSSQLSTKGIDQFVSDLKSLHHNVNVEVIDFLSAWNLGVLFECLDRFTNITCAYLGCVKFANNEKSSYLPPDEIEIKLVKYFKSRNIPTIRIEKDTLSDYSIIEMPQEYIQHRIIHLRESSITTFITTFLG